MSLILDPKYLKIEPALIKRIPYNLADYYQALPLGFEDGLISLAIAHPENNTALTVLQDLLGLSIVPVQAPEGEIRRAINHIYTKHSVTQHRILAWAYHSEYAATVLSIARIFGDERAGNISLLSEVNDLETVLAVASEGAYHLSVLALADSQPLAPLVYQAPTSTVYVRSNKTELRKILLILRGFSSDRLLIDRLMPLLHQKDYSLTLLPLGPDEAPKSQDRYNINLHFKGQITDLLQHSDLIPEQMIVKYRQGKTAGQAADEIIQGAYDLVVIAAEGYGDFVAQILVAIDQCEYRCHPVVFVAKPSLTLAKS